MYNEPVTASIIQRSIAASQNMLNIYLGQNKVVDNSHRYHRQSAPGPTCIERRAARVCVGDTPQQGQLHI
ncbi:hypothetical protein RRG08_038136 [Elysia crispata]|uniref:Uncharacterized protein n=1 Tax=Elysia crispata TaxID=231223 RepID=A0AAE0ZYH5_9GAST|nr:hypothetical protein RRG08_038136 [Elysia crispata]